MNLPAWSILVAPIATAGLFLIAPSPAAVARLSRWGSAAALAVSAWLARAAIERPAVSSHGLLLDPLGAYLAVLVSFLVLAASLASERFLRGETEDGKPSIAAWRAYYGLLHLFAASMLLVPIADNLGILWVAVEATTLSSAFLVGFHRHRHALEAAWKYVVLCSVGLAFALFGTILLHEAGARSGVGATLDWTAFVAAAPRLDPRIVKLGFLFVGYGTKAGLAPLHAWLPDAHGQAPSPVSALLSGALLSCAFYAVMRFHAIAVLCVGPHFLGRVFWAFGLASLAIAAPFILIARDYKRMLAYSSVEHMGLLCVGLGIGSPAAIYGVLLHLWAHGLAKGSAFLSAGGILEAFKTRRIARVTGALARAPASGFFLFAATLGLSGFPPFATFPSEMLILSQGFRSGRAAASAAAAALLAVIFAGLLHHVSRMCLGRASGPSLEEAGPGARLWETVLPPALLVAPLVVLGCWIPGGFDRWLSAMAGIVLGHG